jgi:hypothetical protein
MCTDLWRSSWKKSLDWLRRKWAGNNPTAEWSLQWKKNSTFCPHDVAIYVFFAVFRTKRRLFSYRARVIGFHNRDRICLLRDTS